MKFSSRLQADLTLLFVTVLWGTAFAVLRIASEHGVVYYLNGLRFLLGAILLIPFAIKARETFSWADLPVIALTGAILYAAAAFQMTGLAQTTAGNAGFITSLYVIIVPFILWLFWCEKPNPLLWVAVILAVTGGFLLSTAGTFHFMPGDLIVLVSSLFWGLHVVIVGRFTHRIPTMMFAIGQFLFCGLLNLLTGAFVEHPSGPAMIAILPSVVYTGIFSIAVGFTLQVIGQKHTPAGDAALILSLESVFAAFFGWLIVGERLLPVQVLGCGLILVAVVLAQAKEMRSRRAEPSSS